MKTIQKPQQRKETGKNKLHRTDEVKRKQRKTSSVDRMQLGSLGEQLLRLRQRQGVL